MTLNSHLFIKRPPVSHAKVLIAKPFRRAKNLGRLNFAAFLREWKPISSYTTNKFGVFTQQPGLYGWC